MGKLKKLMTGGVRGVFIVLLVATLAWAGFTITYEGRSMIVDTEGRGKVVSDAIPFATHVNDEEGRLFGWTIYYDNIAGEHVLAVKNTNSDLDLHITGIMMSPDAATGVSVMYTDSWTTPAGTYAVTGANQNSAKSSTVALATAYGKATGFASGTTTLLRYIAAPAANSKGLDVEGKIIIGYGDTIILVADTASTTGSAWTISGYYH